MSTMFSGQEDTSVLIGTEVHHRYVFTAGRGNEGHYSFHAFSLEPQHSFILHVTYRLTVPFHRCLCVPLRFSLRGDTLELCMTEGLDDGHKGVALCRWWTVLQG